MSTAMVSAPLLQALLKFRAERDWKQFHTFRTLTTSILLEAAELAEITQWTRDGEIATVVVDKRDRIEQEVADIAILLSYLIHDMDIDLEMAVATKLQVNAKKYPIEKSKGSARKHDELDK